MQVQQKFSSGNPFLFITEGGYSLPANKVACVFMHCSRCLTPTKDSLNVIDYTHVYTNICM